MGTLKNGPKNNRNKSGAAAAHEDQLRTEAKARQSAYDLLTPAEKIAKLDAGGFVATKQRAKIAAGLIAKDVSQTLKTSVVGEKSTKAKTKQEARKELRDNRHPSRKKNVKT